MATLRSQDFDSLVELLIPLVQTERERAAFVNSLAQGAYAYNIDLGGAARNFAKNLILKLQAYGTSPATGEPLLVTLLQIIRQEVGADKHAEIERLIAVIGELFPSPQFHTHTTEPKSKHRNPYKGLRSFTEADKNDFFGRDRLIQQLQTTLQTALESPSNNTARFLAVILGASGSGKSSVVMAGLLPRLRSGALPNSDQWIYLRDFCPGQHPLSELAARINHIKPSESIPNIKQHLRDEGNLGLHEIICSLTGANKLCVMFIDQFEEIFTQTSNEDERKTFIDNFVEAVTQPHGMLVGILTMRADFLAQVMEYPQLGKLFEKNSHYVMSMTLSELREVVEKPAALEDVNLTFEPGLLDRLLEDVQQERSPLPLLQFTLDQLYHQREGNQLTLQAYETLGGVGGTLGKHAQEIYDSLPSDAHRSITREIFLRLISPGANEREVTRYRAFLSEIISDETPQNTIRKEILGIFTRAHLLTADLNAEQTETIEISHEALIERWGLLREWVQQARQDIVRQKQITADAQEWLQGNKRYELLYRGSVLREAQEWARRYTPSQIEALFLRESDKNERRSRRKQQLQVGTIITSIVLLLTVTTIFFAIKSQIETASAASLAKEAAIALQARATAEQSFREAQSVAWAVHSRNAVDAHQPDVAVALALAANQLPSPPPEAEQALLYAASNSWIRTRFVGQERYLLSVDIRSDTKRMLSGSAYGEIYYWDTDETSPTYRQPLNVFRGHGGIVIDVDFHPDGRQAVSASSDGTIIVWNVDETSPAFATFEQFTSNDDQVIAADYSPDGNFVVTGHSNGVLVLWDLSANPLPSNRIICRLRGHSDRVESVMFSSDGQYIFSGARDNLAMLWRIDLSTRSCGQLEHVFRDGDNWIQAIAISPNGRYLLAGYRDSRIILWDRNSKTKVREFLAHQDGVMDIAFLPNNLQFVSTAWNGDVILWNTLTGEALRTFYGHYGPVWAVAVSSDGREAFSAGDDSTVIRWDLTDDMLVNRYYIHQQSVLSVDIHPSGHLAISFDGDLVHPPYITNAYVWSVETGEILTNLSLPNTRFTTPVNFTRDGSYIFGGLANGEIIFWDMTLGSATFGNMVYEFNRHPGAVTSISLNEAETRMASIHDNAYLMLWDSDATSSRFGEQLLRLGGDGQAYRQAILHPSGNRLLTLDVNNIITLWNVDMSSSQFGNSIYSVEFGEEFANLGKYTPDGEYVVSFTTSGALLVWDSDEEVAEQGNVIHRLAAHTSLPGTLDFSGDGNIAVSTSGNEIVVWDTASTSPTEWHSLRQVRGHQGIIYSAAVRADGLQMLSGASDRTMILWNIRPYPDGIFNWLASQRYAAPLTCQQREFYRLDFCAMQMPTMSIQAPGS